MGWRSVPRACAVVCGLLAGAGCLAAQLFPFRQYHRDEGLPSDSIRCLFQDRKGFLWVGAAHGLCRWDGQRVRIFGAKEGLPGRTVSSLHQTEDGVLWVGTEGGLAYLEGSSFRPVEMSPPVAVQNDGAIASRNGVLYVASTRGLLCRGPEAGAGFDVIPVPAEAGSGQAHSLHLDPDGTLWVTCGSSLCVLGTEGLYVVGRQAGLPDSDWRGVRRDAQGTLWVRDSQSVWYRHKGEAVFHRLKEDLPAPGQPTLHLDPRGMLGIPARWGLRLLSGWPVPRLTEKLGLPMDHPSSLLWDREGNLWVGFEYDGLARLLGRGRWRSWTTQHGLSSNAVNSIQRDPSGRLWVGTRVGLNVLEPGRSEWKTLGSKQGLPNEEIRSLAADWNGGLWIGSGSGGLARLDTNTRAVRVFNQWDGLGDDHIVAVSIEGRESVWALTRRGVYRTRIAGPWKFTKVEFPNHRDRNDVYRVLRARDGTLWAAGQQGLMRWEGGAFRLYGPEIGLRVRSLVFLTEDREGALWMAYDGPNGVSRMRWREGQPQWTHYAGPAVLDSDDISFLEGDARGRIWVGTERGVSVFEQGSWKRFRRDDGLIWEDCVLNSFWADQDGSVMIGTNRGLSEFRAPGRFEPQVLPGVALTSMRLGDREFDGPLSEIRHSDRPLAVRFAVLSYSNEHNVRFRYRLRGLGDDWIETTRGEAWFAGLAAGQYEFEVTACLGDGNWNQDVTRHGFRVLPPWWGSWWFRLGLASAAWGLLMALWRWRIQAHLHQRRELEAVVAERTASLAHANTQMRREMEERERTAREKESLEEQLRQSQKMEAIGRLAGGVAHDFNNLLTVINGYSDLVLSKLKEQDPIRPHLQEVRKAGQRAAELTQQLLAFGRRQHLEPRVLDPNDVIRETETMVRRLVGETIEVVIALSRDAGKVQVDLGRFQQVIMNLVLNARDAMPGGGRLTIETASVHRDGFHSAELADLPPGAYVMLAVSDTGTGMDAEVKAHLFEPFFTTKPKGKGTGLGLSTVFGIVSQSGGHIRVWSEPGRGSSFRIYLPRTDSAGTDPAPESALPQSAGGAETILVVEDQPEVRALTRNALALQGYRVLEAAGGQEALDRCRSHTGPIHLLLTDVVMPGMTGPELAGRLRALRPELRVVFMSGYAGDEVWREGRVQPGEGFIQKPFTAESLAAGVRRILDGAQPSGNAPAPDA